MSEHANYYRRKVTGLERQLSEAQAERDARGRLVEELTVKIDELQAEHKELKERFAIKEDAMCAAMLVIEEQQKVIDRLTVENARLRGELEHYRGIAMSEGAEKALANYNRLREALEDIADGNGDDCCDCEYNTRITKEALGGKE